MKWKNVVRKFMAAVVILGLVLSAVRPAYAAAVNPSTVDPSGTGSLTIYKYDLTSAEDGGVYESYVSSGEVNTDAEHTYRHYALQGVRFSYLRIGEIATHSEVDAATGTASVKVVYGIYDACGDVLRAVGVNEEAAVRRENGLTYYTSDTLIRALADANRNAPVATKNALEEFMAQNAGTVMPETDGEGKTRSDGLPVGLYLIVETAVPEDVTVTTDPFLVSLPMTDPEGGSWIYDVTVYPKNRTGEPDLKKEVAEVTSGPDPLVYSTAATASMGDVLAYQITSTLPLISSEATYLTAYTFVDRMDKGLDYNRTEPVTLTWTAPDGTLAATWQKEDGRFTVEYGTDSDGRPVMTITMTEAGLAEINPAYSRYTVVIDYTATVLQNGDVNLGDAGNVNEVELTWKRTNTEYYDTRDDSNRVYTFGLEILKRFSDGNGDPTQVRFNLRNATDGYFVTAREEESGLYYVTGTAEQMGEGATVFSPAVDGTLMIRGLENDSYILTELGTDDGYTLLKNDIKIVIGAELTAVSCDEYSCTHMEHRMIIGSAAVNGDAVTMGGDHGTVPLTIVNERSYEVPPTGDTGTFILPIIGIVGSVCLIIIAHKTRVKESV